MAAEPQDERPVSIPESAFGAMRQEEITYEAAIERVTPEYCQEVIHQYREWHNLSNETQGGKLSHNLLTDGLYSRHNLPVLMTMYQWANSEESPTRYTVRADTAMAIYSIGSALSILTSHMEDTDLTPSAAFADLRAAQLTGDQKFATFLSDMQTARTVAATAIYNHREKLPETVPLPILKNLNGDTFANVAYKALMEFQESEEGVNLGPAFAERLNDPNTKAIVISLDVNSTLNMDESFANMPLLDRLAAQLQALADRLKQTYPDKQLYIVPNTGRPGKYLWGVWELGLPPIPELRRFALAESGGTVLHLDGNKYKPKVAVEKPTQWRAQLDNLKQYLASETRSKYAFVDAVEEKDSMLSVQIANRGVDGGAFIHSATTGETVTDEWIAQKVEQFLQESEAKYRAELEQLREQMTYEPRAVELINKLLQSAGPDGPDQKPNTGDELFPEATKVIQGIIGASGDHRAHQMKEVTESLETIILMKSKLNPLFNATAGYMDIGHGDLNKISTLFHEVEKDGFKPEEILAIHIGDSSTDIIPETETGPGEINEGADQAYLIALANSSTSLKDAVKRRHTRGHAGILTAREAILGVSDTIMGILRVIPQAPPGKAYPA